MPKIVAAIALASLLAAAALTQQPAKAPVVVELFTSQGCSSCPPADELLRTINRDPSVIALAFHVDYWNSHGWQDPFSSRDATIRQMQYVRGMKLPSAYTPQVVVHGTAQMVGSDGNALRKAIANASSQRAEGSVAVKTAGSEIAVDANAPAAGLELLVLIVENDVTTNVVRGENKGKTLQNDAIVRRFTRLHNVNAGRGSYRVPLQLEATWKRPDLAVVAMLQDPKTLKIHVAARARL